MLSPQVIFSPDALDRHLAPTRPSAAERKDLALALLAAAALHLIIPLGLLAYYALWPAAVPMAQEIPVEVVIEPPPKQKTPEEKPKPPPEPDEEKPAYDAPRAATPEKVNRNSSDDVTQAPPAKAEPPPSPGAPQKAEAQPAPAEERRMPGPAPQLDLAPTTEGEEAAAPTAAPAEADAAENPSPNPARQTAPEPPPEAPAGAPLPTIDVLPQYKFARAVKESPVAGGSAESRYFTIVFGMIMSHMREPSGPHPNAGGKRGAVDFAVDEAGNLLGRKLASSSGSPNLDMAVMAAIAEAAPYPAPPNWRPKYMRFSFGGK